MSAGRLKKNKQNNNYGGNRAKRVFVMFFGIMAIVGFFLSKGSVTQFFKVLAIEAAVFAFIVFLIFAAYKNKKRLRVVDGGKKHKNSYGMNDESKDDNVKKYVSERIYDESVYHRSIKNVKTKEKNYNWVIEDEGTQSTGKRKESFESGRKLVYAGKITPDEKGKKDSDDIKVKVANWAEAVDFSDAVFKRILEKTKESIEEEKADHLEDNSENTQEAVDNVDSFLQEEMVYKAIDSKEETEEIFDISEEQYEEKNFRDPKETGEVEIPEAVEAKEIKIIGEISVDEDIKEEVEINELPAGEEIDKEIGYFDNGLEIDEIGVVYETEEMDEIDGEFEIFDNEIEIEETGEMEQAEETEEAFEIEDSEEIVGIDEIYEIDEAEEANEIEKTDEINKLQRPLKRNAMQVVPPLELLEEAKNVSGVINTGVDAERKAQKLIDTLESFGVGARIINISQGPAVTRYELQPDYGVKVSKIVSLTDDIALNLAAVGVRIEAPIPGKAAIGIEIPNREVTPVLLREVIESDSFQNHPSKLAFAVGKDIAGNSVVADIAAMPHLLIAGATGSGKSVCINTLITSLLYKAQPKDVRLLMVDPKVVELSIYNGIPHLLIPVVTDPKKAAGALNWAIQEMTNRYKLFAENNVKDLKGYNRIMSMEGHETLPQIVIIIDELADLMMVAPNEVEDCICRLAQMARAAGMHLVIATQRPSVNVITGVIKANIPSRIAFAVSSQVDSRTILDMSGAEKLLGKGDMLFYPMGMQKPIRVQGSLITDKEVEKIVNYIKSKHEAEYDEEIIDTIDSHSDSVQLLSEDDDELLPQVIDLVVEQEQASTSLIQRKFKIGYARAARIIDQLEAGGIVGPFEGSKPRKVLITKQQWQEMKS